MDFITLLAVTLGCAVLLMIWWNRRGSAAPPDDVTIWWRGNPGELRPDAGSWAMCASAIYAVDAIQYWDEFAYESPAGDPDAETKGLREYWGIVDRQSLLYQLHGLLTAGHRRHLRPMVDFYAALSDDETTDLLRDIAADEGIDETERTERIWQVKAVRQNLDSIRSVDFGAWDFVRFINLCRGGVAAGLVERKEAEDFALIACRELQKCYRGWEECADHFLRARRFWQASDAPAARANQREFVKVADALKRHADSPWRHVPWDLALPEPRWLFVQALIDVVLAPVLGKEERRDADALALEMDAVARNLLRSDA